MYYAELAGKVFVHLWFLLQHCVHAQQFTDVVWKDPCTCSVSSSAPQNKTQFVQLLESKKQRSASDGEEGCEPGGGHGSYLALPQRQ